MNVKVIILLRFIIVNVTSLNGVYASDCIVLRGGQRCTVDGFASFK